MYTREMIGLNFEQSPQDHSPHFSSEDIEKRDRLTVDEIHDQLEITETKFEDALKKFNEGNMDDKEYLEAYQANLVDWMNDIKIMEGTLLKKNEEVLFETERRLYLVSEALKQKLN